MSEAETAAAEVATGAPPPEGSEAPPPEVNPEIEARARRMGWKPREHWNGPANAWRDAAEYVERGEAIMPLLLERNRALDAQNASFKKQIEEQGTTLAEMLARSRKAEEIGYRRARREIEQRREAAVQMGDVERFNAAERELAELGQAPPPTQPEPAPRAATNGATPAPANGQPPPPDPVVASWMRENPWFQSDPEANASAVAIHGVISQQMPHLSLEEKLAETTARMRRRFPELFAPAQAAADPAPATPSNPRRSAPSPVSASSTAASRAVKPRSFDAMPADVKQQYQRTLKMLDGKGPPLSKDDFAEYYWEQFPEDGT